MLCVDPRPCIQAALLSRPAIRLPISMLPGSPASAWGNPAPLAAACAGVGVCPPPDVGLRSGSVVMLSFATAGFHCSARQVEMVGTLYMEMSTSPVKGSMQQKTMYTGLIRDGLAKRRSVNWKSWNDTPLPGGISMGVGPDTVQGNHTGGGWLLAAACAMDTTLPELLMAALVVLVAEPEPADMPLVAGCCGPCAGAALPPSLPSTDSLRPPTALASSSAAMGCPASMACP
mmetsp:Transcript_32799/g.83253  ORF Transcript_32799/g.83253 Transcript_32799/m.83253 type:complete len:231 (+) Transcript_32799:916-1608(+)